MLLALAGSAATADPIDALVGPAPNGTSPLDDMNEALHGRLGLVLALAALGLVAWLMARSMQRRRQAARGQQVMIRTIASRGFALYTTGPATPGVRVDALVPSWPAGRTLLEDGAEALPVPRVEDLSPPPWATWVARPSR